MTTIIGDSVESAFGLRLRGLRERAGLTQEQLAERSGLSAKGVSALERGERRRPYVHTVAALADALGLVGEERAQFLAMVRPRSADSPIALEDSRTPLGDAPLGGITFAQTKLYPPRPRINLLRRGRLESYLRQALDEARLVLVSAPAGSGKTMLVAGVLAEVQMPVAWITLDEDDNDLNRFLWLLCAALEQLAPCACAEACALLSAERLLQGVDPVARGRQALSALLNGLLAESAPAMPRVLVLDDLHTITDAAVYSLLAYLVERLPEHLVLVIASRYDPPLPLARLRVRHELAELRLPQLRFTEAETTAWLGDRLGGLLGEGEALELHARTEGWAAGLSLLASSLESMTSVAERGHFLKQVGLRDRYLFDYLADEILNRQEPEVREFLAVCSILPILTPELCAAVSGRADAQQLLDTLYQRNLFLVALVLPDGAPAYRYHDLFAVFLREALPRLASVSVRDLHARAASATRDPRQRIRHWLAAEAWEPAAILVEQVAPELIGAGGHRDVQVWIGMLPPAVATGRPWLLYWQALCAWRAFDLIGAQTWFRRALAAFEAAQDLRGQEAARAWMAVGLSYWDDLNAAGVWVADELAKPLSDVLRAQILVGYSMGLMLNGEGARAIAVLNQALDLAESTRAADVLGAIVAGVQSPHAVLPGGTTAFERLIELIGAPNPADPPPIQCDRLAIRAMVSLTRGDWDTVFALCEEINGWAARAEGDVTWLFLNAGGFVDGLQTLLGVRDPVPDVGLAHFVGMHVGEGNAFVRVVVCSYCFYQARHQWLRGEIAATEAGLRRMQMLGVGEAERSVYLYRLMLGGLLAHSADDDVEAMRLLGEAWAMQSLRSFTQINADAGVLLAAVAYRVNGPQAALAHFGPRLAYYAEHNMPGMLMWNGAFVLSLLRLALAHGVCVDFAQATLARFEGRVPEVVPSTGKPAPLILPEWTQAATARSRPGDAPDEVSDEAPPTTVPPTRASLTPREEEVLRLLLAGASNGEIAQALVISAHTVKHHVSHVLAKVGVVSRTELLLWARASQID